MSVPKGRRQESRFEAQHNFYKVRGEVTALVLNDFGFSEEKYRKKMEKYRAAHSKDANIDDIVARWAMHPPQHPFCFMRQSDSVLADSRFS